ncbi:MAG: hypothetical protein RLZZ76_561 [Candidatus Parcubacteria bacterium]|jgi:cell fate (sporulation/competence/biofilm development) regulator YmcA (YheA/YmcA/DUF963 family)
MRELRELRDSIERLKAVRSSIETRAISMLTQEVRKKVEHMKELKKMQGEVELLRKQNARRHDDRSGEQSTDKAEEERTIQNLLNSGKVLSDSYRQSLIELERLEKETTSLQSEIRRAFN